MTNKPQTPFIASTRAEGTFVGLGAVAVTLLTTTFLGEDGGSVAGIAVGALVCLVVISWPLRKERWFWILFSIFCAVNAFAVAHFDWSFTHDWRGRDFALLLMPDLGVMIGIVYAIYCGIYGKPRATVAELPDPGPTYSERDLDL